MVGTAQFPQGIPVDRLGATEIDHAEDEMGQFGEHQEYSVERFLYTFRPRVSPLPRRFSFGFISNQNGNVWRSPYATLGCSKIGKRIPSRNTYKSVGVPGGPFFQFCYNLE